MSSTVKHKLMTFLDVTGFAFVSLVMYLYVVMGWPLSEWQDSFSVVLAQDHPVIRALIPVIWAVGIWLFFIVGVWIRSWVPQLDSIHVGNYILASYFLATIHTFYWTLVWDRMGPNSPHGRMMIVFLVLFFLLQIFMRNVPVQEPEKGTSPNRALALEYWFYGWALFYTANALIKIPNMIASDVDSGGWILAGIGMGYWSFLMAIDVRKNNSRKVTGWVKWSSIVTLVLLVATLAVMAAFRIWG